MATVEGITIDFYETLIHNRDGKGRGRLYHEYLSAKGLSAATWEHQVLYDVFEYYHDSYRPSLSAGDKLTFWSEFTARLFRRTDVRGKSAAKPEEHAESVRDIFGPSHFVLYGDVVETLESLRAMQRPLLLLSNWQKGLRYICEELGILHYFEHVISSAELALEKPDQRIFTEASRRLKIPPERLLHVGDQLVDDVQGARSAGFQAFLLDRSGECQSAGVDTIRDLRELAARLS